MAHFEFSNEKGSRKILEKPIIPSFIAKYDKYFIMQKGDIILSYTLDAVGFLPQKHRYQVDKCINKAIRF